MKQVNWDYRHLKGDPDLGVGSRPTAAPLNQGVQRRGAFPFWGGWPR